MIRLPLQTVCLLTVLWLAPACGENRYETNVPTRAITLPPGTIMDGQGVLIGPHAGTLTRAGDFFLESVFVTSGAVQIYAYDARGEMIPVSDLNMTQITLETNQGPVTVSLQRADPYYMMGYYDAAYFSPFYYGGYPYFYVHYPEVITIREIPSTVYRPAYRGVGSDKRSEKYPTKVGKGYPTKATRVVVTAQRPVPPYSPGKGSSKK